MSGIHRWPVNSPHKWPVTWKMFPFSGDIDRHHHWFRQSRVAWWHQAITRINLELQSVVSSDIHLRAISQGIPLLSFVEMSLKIAYLKFQSNLPGANELINMYSLHHAQHFVWCSWFLSIVISQCLNSPATQVFVQQIVQVGNKETPKLLIAGSLGWESKGYWWIPLTKGEYCGQRFHVMMCSWYQGNHATDPVHCTMTS